LLILVAALTAKALFVKYAARWGFLGPASPSSAVCVDFTRPELAFRMT